MDKADFARTKKSAEAHNLLFNIVRQQQNIEVVGQNKLGDTMKDWNIGYKTAGQYHPNPYQQAVPPVLYENSWRRDPQILSYSNTYGVNAYNTASSRPADPRGVLMDIERRQQEIEPNRHV